MQCVEQSAITREKLDSYFHLSRTALGMAKQSKNPSGLDDKRAEFLDIITRYISDAEFFDKKGDMVNAFAALNYAHGWLDAGARMGLFDVHDSRYFATD